MEQEELLLKDLCARLPYEIKGLHRGGIQRLLAIDSFGSYQIDGYDAWFDLNSVIFKPYLFPLSSMTEEQCYELGSICSEFQDCWKYIKTPIPLSICNFEQIDWFNKNHFDYRCLIERGLAIDATGLNIY